MTRSLRRAVGWLLTGVLLFAQWSVAAYACPALMPVDTTMPADCASMNDGPLDPAAPNLCAEHCKVGYQSDQTSTPVLAPALLHRLYIVPPALPAQPAALAALTPVAASPPHLLLHCCRRD